MVYAIIFVIGNYYGHYLLSKRQTQKVADDFIDTIYNFRELIISYMLPIFAWMLLVREGYLTLLIAVLMTSVILSYYLLRKWKIKFSEVNIGLKSLLLIEITSAIAIIIFKLDI